MFENRICLLMSMCDLLDYENYLTHQIHYYQQCQKTGCKISEKRYFRYLNMRNKVIEAINELDS